MNQKNTPTGGWVYASPLLLALIAVLVLGGGAYVYVQNKQVSQSAAISPITQATSTANYFEIKEVGLKFKITDDIKDLTYSIINEGNGATYVWFSTKTLENLGGKNCNSDQAPLGGIGVWQKDISGGAMAITYLIKSNNFSVTYGTPQSICSSVKEAQDLQMKQLRSLSEALKTIIRTDTTTADWKTYESDKYGFSFTYPDINTRLKSVGGWADANEPKITSRTPFNYDECVSAGEGPGSNGSKITIAGREYCLITISGVEPRTFSSQYEYISHIGNEDIGIVFSFSGNQSGGQQVDKEARVLFSQILSTLKFTK